MNKYANPKDELRIKETIARAVCNGRSVFAIDEDGNRPPDFKDFNLNEIGICASDMIVDGLLVEHTGPESVFVVNASNGYKPTSVIPSKGLKSWLGDLKVEKNSNHFLVKYGKQIILAVITTVIGTVLSQIVIKYFIK